MVNRDVVVVVVIVVGAGVYIALGRNWQMAWDDYGGGGREVRMLDRIVQANGSRPGTMGSRRIHYIIIIILYIIYIIYVK